MAPSMRMDGSSCGGTSDDGGVPSQASNPGKCALEGELEVDTTSRTPYMGVFKAFSPDP